MKTKRKNDYPNIGGIVDFFFEVGYLNHIKRSPRKQQERSIAEHSFRVTIIGYTLAMLEKADVQKTVLMCLFHDLSETRTGDADLINRCYTNIFEQKALNDMIKGVSFRRKIKNVSKSLWSGRSKEAKIAHDADILEELLAEKEQYDKGIREASRWMTFSVDRLLTEGGKKIGKEITNHNSNCWWHLVFEENYLKNKEKK